MNLEKDLSKYANKAIFYITLDPERALGLEDILPKYTIICPYKSQLTENFKRDGVGVIVLEESVTVNELDKIVQRGTYGILQFVHDRKIIDKNDYVMVLKNSEIIEDFCKKQGWRLLSPKAKIAEQFENKISQYKLLKNIVPYPPSFVCRIREFNTTVNGTGSYSSGTSAGERARSPKYRGRAPFGGPTPIFGGASRGQNESPRWGDECIPKNNFPYRLPAVLQFNRGHSGNSTFFIKSRKDIEKLYKLYPKREAKVSEYIKGKTYTLNCFVLKSGEVIMGSLSEQITGFKSATNNPNTTCGNDFISPQKLSEKQIRKIQEIAKKTGTALHKKGYRGMFGIDVIIQQGTGDIYFIEVNTHQPASISFEAKLHRKIGKVPLLAYFVLDNLSSPSLRRPASPERRRGERGLGGGRPPLILPIKAKQIIYRNKTSKVLTRRVIEGKYKGRGLISRMKHIKPNEEIFRKQLVK